MQIGESRIDKKIKYFQIAHSKIMYASFWNGQSKIMHMAI